MELRMTQISRDNYIYKVLTHDQWAGFQQNSMFSGSPVDLKDGFIHLSCASQLKETMDKWYADHTEVVVLQVVASKISATLKYEISRGGAEFPHLFSDLPIAAISKVWLVVPDKGVYRLPNDLTPN